MRPESLRVRTWAPHRFSGAGPTGFPGGDGPAPGVTALASPDPAPALPREALAGGDAGRAAAYTSRDGQSPNVRRMLVDLIEEYARQVGHADLLRESVDERVGEGPPEDVRPW
ncbi:DUF664 domain-containing protein [Streptomyces sp. NPDC101110]|uniref:mycothiol transferase n=1 Tax=unclassified Streptomyces TaxID=2593676 RepID=UPI00380AF35A